LIKLKVLAGRSAAEISKDIKASFEEVLTDENTDENTFWLTGEKSEKDVEKIFYHKIVAKNEQIYDLEMSVLADFQEKYEERAEKLLSSFRVK